MNRLGLLLLCVLATATAKSIKPRIVNGIPAIDGQFPWQAAIYVTTPQRTTFCGGSLIHEQWVVTAGHCVNGATSFTIYLGSVSLTRFDENRLIVQVSDYILHPEFNSETFENDVGLINLGAPVVTSNYIRVIPMEWSYLAPGAPVIVSGWGKTNDSSSTISEDLYYVTLLTITNYECNIFYSNAVAAKAVCAVGNGQSTCAGDSGGGLIAYNSEGTAQHVGIASFVSSAGCESTHPSGYTRTSYYLNWINNEIKTHT